jgi:hypothetical protein
MAQIWPADSPELLGFINCFLVEFKLVSFVLFFGVVEVMILGFNSEFNNELGLDFAMVVIPDDILEF